MSGWIWEAFFKTSDAGHLTVLKTLVKLPAILADLGVGVLLYAIARRFASATSHSERRRSTCSTPRSSIIRRSTGKSIRSPAGFALLAVFLLLRSDDDEPEQPDWYVVFAWLALAYSLLIKPQAAVAAAALPGFAFVDPRAAARGSSPPASVSSRAWCSPIVPDRTVSPRQSDRGARLAAAIGTPTGRRVYRVQHGQRVQPLGDQAARSGSRTAIRSCSSRSRCGASDWSSPPSRWSSGAICRIVRSARS